MKVSDLIPLEKGVFQLEEGHGKWDIDRCETVVIAFAGSETMLDLNEFGDDQEVLCVISQSSVGPSLTACEVFHRHSRIAVLKQWKSITRAGTWNQHSKGLKSSHQQYSNFSPICLLDRK
jgi:hypothetical protein